jgi:hypothetical protein
MSIEFTMWRISPAAYTHARESGVLGPERVAVEEAVAKDWDVLARILADGRVPLPVTGAARAIAGGEVLPYDEMDYGGTRVLSPDLVREVASELAEIGDADVESRYLTVDFTDCYGTNEGGAHASPVEHYVTSFHELRDFYAAAAKAGDAMAVWLG